MVNILLAIVNTAELSWQQWNSVIFCFVIRAKKVGGGGEGGDK